MAQSLFINPTPTLCFKGQSKNHGNVLFNANKPNPWKSSLAKSTSPRALETEIPTHWYNIIADLPIKPPPPLHPKTFAPLQPQDLSHLFPDELIKQEASDERFIVIPDEVVDIYRLWRPTPLIRAKRLEKLLDTPARIYYKYEGVSPAGSHKPNTAVPQVWYNAQQGVKNVVWQVRASYDQKPYRKLMMQTWGAKVHPSPSNLTESGRKILEMDPLSPGSLGIAISEAVEMAALNEDTKYCLGSVLNHVLLHQTVIGEECIKQMEDLGETPDVIIGCTGGGSNFAGLCFPFIREKLKGKMNPLIRAVEPTACPSLTKGGLRYHGMAPLLSHIYELGFMEAIAIPQTECFRGAIQFARSEGLIPAPEPTHAIAAAIREALHCKESGESKVILMAMCGHDN
ncbi:Tryptophan synthase beta chain/beta chain-like protein [Cynara cardunculus var. scolymus]|uniref:tryptophan synthase n=1 Tax=Cynara cardunculus var. scolymus TaxID=59895 RepID=A0A103YH52_CYNCS|nr:Tryptophan synthase beta chain/beta chain-like protein [Cynara cardunculus var. scolymus]